MFSRHVVKSLTRYSDGELSAAEAQRVDAHLASCAQCRATLDEIQFSARLVRRLSTVSAPPSLWNAIDAALAESPSGGSASGGVFGRRLQWAAAFVML